MRRAMVIFSARSMPLKRANVQFSTSGIVRARFYSTTKPQDREIPSTAKNTVTQEYIFDVGACSIPHPEKEHKGGEDAYFYSSDNKVIGVADGVGGWADVGVDPAKYSKQLMKGGKDYCEENIKKSHREDGGGKGGKGEERVRLHDPQKILMAGYESAKGIEGSSTACICVLEGLQLKTANIGDSGYMIIRSGKVFYASSQQQKSFNFPYQIGSSGDNPNESVKKEQTINVGDVVVAVTDGVLDNIYPEEVAKLTATSSSAHSMATSIGKAAQAKAKQTTGDSPFASAARKARYNFQGGKMDDITVVVGIVTQKSTVEPAQGA